MPLYVCLRLCAASSRLPLRVCVGGVCLSVRLFVASASSRIYGASCASHFRLGTRSCARTSCPRRWKPPGRSCSQRCVLRCAVAACHVLYHVHRDDTHGVGVRWHGQGARHFQWLRGTSKKTAAAAAANKKKKRKNGRRKPLHKPPVAVPTARSVHVVQAPPKTDHVRSPIRA